MKPKEASTVAAGEAPKRRPGRPRLLEPSADYVARREDILAAAARVFHEKGYDAGTLDDVADALDLRRASLYYYVRSKSNLLYMLFERALDVALARMDELLEIEDPTERLEALIRHQIRTVAGEPSLFSVFFDDRPRLEERYEEEIRKREHQYLEVYRRAVEAASAAGAIGGGDPRYASQAIFGMMTWCYKWFRPGRDDIDELAETCVSLILGRDGKRSGRSLSAAPRRPVRSLR
jgi:AcrR family transcriptional regulator